jgi:antitoxin (DNA-binding transcriptional repressor) of toxin-antitoxin stability system
MKTIAAARLKERCLDVLDDLDEEGVVITRGDKPVAKIVPWKQSSKELIGALKGRVKIRGDILSTGKRWDAES